jgi:hypothetical protein
VPGDVALAGYDNVEAAAHLSLTSIACPMRLMGQVAARWAVDLLTRNERPVGHRLQVRLVVRNSSAGKQGALPQSQPESELQLSSRSRSHWRSHSHSPTGAAAGDSELGEQV